MTSIKKLDSSTEPDWWLGGAIFLCLNRSARWIRRRVESVTFLDATSMQRRVSVDFSVPDETISPGDPPPVVPLALLEKRPLVDFDLQDESGQSLSVLTRQENGFVAWSAMARIAQFEAEDAFGPQKSLPTGLLADLKIVAGGAPPDAMEALRRLGGEEDRALRAVLRDSQFFMSLALSLAGGFLLLTRVSESPGTPRVVKFAYAQELEFPPETRLERFAARMGFSAAEYGFWIPAVGESESYHFEFQAPPGLEVSAAELVVLPQRPETDTIAEDVDDDAEDFTFEAHPGRVVGPLAHVYVSEVAPEHVGIARVWVRPPLEGLLRAGLASTLLATVIFFFFLWDDRIKAVEGSGPAGLLLAVPSLLAAVLVRPGEHRMATNLFSGIRGVTATSGLMAYVGAILIIGKIKDPALVNSWRVLAIVSGICFLALVGAAVSRRPAGMLSEEGDGFE